MVNFKKFQIFGEENKDFYCEPANINIITAFVRNGEACIVLCCIGKINKYVKGDFKIMAEQYVGNQFIPFPMKTPKKDKPAEFNKFTGYLNVYNISSIEEGILHESIIHFLSGDTVIIAEPVKKIVHLLIQKKKEMQDIKRKNQNGAKS